MDLSADEVVLGAGTWWISIVPITDENPYAIIGSRSDLHQNGSRMYVRDGGVAHGTGYAGIYGSDEWVDSSVALVGDMAVRIDGYAVPAPGGVALLVSANLIGLRRRRR